MSTEYVTQNQFELTLANIDLKFTNLELKISNLEAKMDARFQRLEDKLDNFIDTVHRHYATKAEVFAIETKLAKWVIGSVIASTGLAATIAFGLARLLA